MERIMLNSLPITNTETSGKTNTYYSRHELSKNHKTCYYIQYVRLYAYTVT